MDAKFYATSFFGSQILGDQLKLRYNFLIRKAYPSLAVHSQQRINTHILCCLPVAKADADAAPFATLFCDVQDDIEYVWFTQTKGR